MGVDGLISCESLPDEDRSTLPSGVRKGLSMHW
jgi:hypothetical protein